MLERDLALRESIKVRMKKLAQLSSVGECVQESCGELGLGCQISVGEGRFPFNAIGQQWSATASAAGWFQFQGNQLGFRVEPISQIVAEGAASSLPLLVGAPSDCIMRNCAGRDSEGRGAEERSARLRGGCPRSGSLSFCGDMAHHRIPFVGLSALQ